MPSELRIAVIGAGHIGRQHARIYRGLANCRLVAVADVDGARARSVAGEFDCRAYEDHRVLLAHEAPDAVSVTVPTAEHLAVARDVIGAGVALLVEKPIAGTPAEGAEIVELARRAGLPLAVGHVERFNPAVRALKDLVEAGTFGDVLSVATRRVGVLPPRAPQTNVIVDLAVHDIDVVSLLLGRRPELRAVMSGRAWHLDHNDWADLLLAYGPASCVIQVNWVTPIKIRTLCLTGTAGYAELNYAAQSLTLYETSSLREVADYAEFLARYGSLVTREIPVVHEEPLQAELASFIGSVTSGGPVAVTGEMGLSALIVAYEAWSRSQAVAAVTAG